MNKICQNCKIYKLLTEFYKKKDSKDGLRYVCKDCEKIINKKNYQKNKNHKELYCKYCDNTIIRIKEEMQTKYKCKICYKKMRKIQKKIARKKYNKTEKGKINNKKSKNNWKNNNPYYNKKYQICRYNNDEKFKLIHNVRSRLRMYLQINNIRKDNKTFDSIGCSPEMLKKWIDFNLNLDNLKEYHIYHLKPLSSFKCKTYEEVIQSKCNHWTNLIPILPKYNLKKSNKNPNKHELFKQELRLFIFKYKII